MAVEDADDDEAKHADESSPTNSSVVAAAGSSSSVGAARGSISSDHVLRLLQIAWSPRSDFISTSNNDDACQHLVLLAAFTFWGPRRSA